MTHNLAILIIRFYSFECFWITIMLLSKSPVSLISKVLRTGAYLLPSYPDSKEHRGLLFPSPMHQRKAKVKLSVA